MAWQDVFNAKDNRELAQQYDIWAKDYESDVADYVGPLRSVEVLTRYAAPEARILDAGCGTGLCGQILHARGYLRVEGLDLSTGMLAEARRKNCYAALHQQALGGPLDFPGDFFDAIVCVGIFARAHVPSRSLDELIRITRPEGYIVSTLRTLFYENSDFRDKMAALEEAGQWRLVEAGESFQAIPESDPDFYMRVWVHRITNRHRT
ncbi:MAG: class I SAM-dependent DNA methyltransferase [Methylococcales bacterium]